MFKQKKNKMKNFQNHVSILAVIISIVAIIVSIKSCSDSQKFNEINAEVQWNTVLESYRDIDNKLLSWEKENNLERKGNITDNDHLKEIIFKLKSQLNVPDHIINLYYDRSNIYKSLSNIAIRYEEVKDRFTHIDFSLPNPPEEIGFPYKFPFKLK